MDAAPGARKQSSHSSDLTHRGERLRGHRFMKQMRTSCPWW